MTPEQRLKMGPTIVVTQVGSRMFGTQRPDSDYDFIHIYKPHLSRMLLGKNDQPAQEKVVHENGRVDEHTHWSVQHFFKLLAQGQTQALEVAFATSWHAGDPKIQYSHHYWTAFQKDFKGNPKKWLSKNTAAFVGYCRSQANKYSVKGERLEAVNTVLEYLKDLPKTYNGTLHMRLADYSPSVIGDILSYHQVNEYIDVVSIPSGHGGTMLHLSVCGKKCPWHFTLKEAIAIYQRLYDEYGARAKASSDNGNVDWKALSHAARVTIEAKELLTDHTITLPLKQAEWIRNIKNGNVAEHEVTEFLDTGLAEIEHLRETSTLAEKVDQELYDEWIIRAYKGEKVGS
jgi:hypothetical protein